MRVFATRLLIVSNCIDFDKLLCKMLQKQTEDTRSATTNFGKEEVLKVFDQNIQMIHFILFSLSRINGTLPYRYMNIYIYIYTRFYARQCGPAYEDFET